MIDCSSRIYRDTLGHFTDDGNYLIMDKEWSNSVGFIEGIKGYRIQKSYLAEQLQWKCSCRFGKKEFQESDESFLSLIQKTTDEILTNFNKEIEGYYLLANGDQAYHKMNNIFDELERDYISYVLKSELWIEKNRISEIVDNIPESIENADDETYWKWIIHEIDYPDESEEEWKAREARDIEFAEKLKNMTEEELDNLLEESEKKRKTKSE